MDATSHLGFNIPVLLRLFDGDNEEVQARICRVNTGFFQVHSYVPLKCERRLEILYQDRNIKAQVVYCQHQEAGGYHIGLKMASGSYGTIRQELRLPVDVRATMRIPGMTEALRVRLIDMSQSGLGLIVAKAIPEGALAALEMDHGTAFGEIRSCRQQSKRTYRLGFWLEEFLGSAAKPALNDKRGVRNETRSTLKAVANRIRTTLHLGGQVMPR
jgi:hypothetical protein